jgi:hypothetical protein
MYQKSHLFPLSGYNTLPVLSTTVESASIDSAALEAHAFICFPTKRMGGDVEMLKTCILVQVVPNIRKRRGLQESCVLVYLGRRVYGLSLQ